MGRHQPLGAGTKEDEDTIGRERVIATPVSIPAARSRLVTTAEVALLGACCAVLFFFGLGSFGLVGADEPRYAQIAREMLARHDWIVPVLNGKPWLEKPPLYYWCAMLSYRGLGFTDAAARVPAAVLAAVMVFALYAFMRKLRGAGALDAALMTASSVGVIGFARGGSTDMPLAATFTVGMLAWYAWLVNSQRRWLLVFYVCMALGTLAKGPVAPFLAGAIVVAYALLRPRADAATRWGVIAKTLWWPGVLLFIALALPWYVAVQWKTGDFLRVFILEHNLARFGTNLYRHKQPFWYYVPVLLVSVAPWLVLFVAGIVDALRSALRRDPDNVESAADEAAIEDRDWYVFVLLWLGVIVVFFSISQSKLPGYILPATPAATILAAGWVRRRVKDDDEPRFWLIILHAAVAGLLLTAVLLAPHAMVKSSPPAEAITIAAAAGFVVSIVATIILRARGLRFIGYVTLVPVLLSVVFVVRMVAPLIDATQSTRPLSQRLLNRAYRSGSRVLAFHVKREVEYGLDYYGRSYGVPPVVHYDGGPLPYDSVMIVAPRGSEDALRKALPASVVLSEPSPYGPQHLELYDAIQPVGERRTPD